MIALKKINKHIHTNMTNKKNPNSDLESSKSLFLQMGLLLSLGFLFIAFEFSKTEINTVEIDFGDDIVIEEEAIPITRAEEPPPPPPPPPPAFTEILNIVDDDIKLEDELELDDMEMDEDKLVEILDFEEEEEKDDNHIFVAVEKMPSFPGGQSALMRYLQKNLEYPNIAQENGIQGRVYVNFIVNKKGEISKVKILKGVDQSLNNEAIRVVGNMPNWEPGQQMGKTVNVSCNVPINFNLK